MVDSPTTRGRFRKQTTNGNFNLWGDLLNTDVIDMMDEAIFGFVSVAVAANVVLTSVNYATDQSRPPILRLTGAGGFNVKIPAVSKWGVVDNQCAAACVITTGAGATASVAAGLRVVYFCDGTNVYVAAVSGVGAVKRQTFTSSGTYTPSAGMLYAIIECVGGGGGGGGMGNASAGAQGCSGSGGGGGYSRKVVTAADIGASKTVTIGAGGAAGTAGGGNGGNAGDTSVGTLCIAKGGSAGSGGANGALGAGGIAGTGDVTVPGASGETGLASSIVTVNLRRSAGGASALGFGAGGPGGPGQANGNAGSGYGGGGGGAQSSNAGGTAAGGAGTAGIVIITEFCLS